MNANQQRSGLSSSPPLSSSSLTSTLSSGPSQQQQPSTAPTSAASSSLKPGELIDSRVKFQHTVELKSGLSKGRKLSHKRHMRKLQKELDYLQDTAWMYPSVDKLLGQN